jgi:hypothetical protein
MRAPEAGGFIATTSREVARRHGGSLEAYREAAGVIAPATALTQISPSPAPADTVLGCVGDMR